MGHEASRSEEQDRGATEALWVQRLDGDDALFADDRDGTAAHATRGAWPLGQSPILSNLRL